MGDFIVIAILAVIVFLCIRYMRAQKSSCNGDCAHCGGCGNPKNK